jgi:phage tail-like protein
VSSESYPFHAHNFSVEIVPDGASEPLCAASFAECDGLEMTLDVKTVREGGNNGVAIRLAGPMAYGQLVLRRGMTTRSGELWAWFDRVVRNPGVRATGHIVVHRPDGTGDDATFELRRCLPVKLKAPPLNGKDGLAAVEELQVAYESLHLVPGGGAGG